MALVRDFEIPGTGVTVNDAYHVIVNVTTEKDCKMFKLHQILPLKMDLLREIKEIQYIGELDMLVELLQKFMLLEQQEMRAKPQLEQLGLIQLM